MAKFFRKKLSQEVSDGILEMIQSGTILPGQQIPPENELAETFHVSRTAIREGVKVLVAVGTLETRHGIGTFVKDGQLGPLRLPREYSSPNSITILNDLLEFRLIVEPEMAALAAQRRTNEDIELLQRCVEVLQTHVLSGKPGKPPEDLGFHLGLAKATRNSALMDTSSMIARFYEDDPYSPDVNDINDHRAIFESIRDGNSLAAHKRMEKHLLRQRDKYASTD